MKKNIASGAITFCTTCIHNIEVYNTDCVGDTVVPNNLNKS